MRRALFAVAVALAGCADAERDPSQWPIARVELEREIPTDDPAEATYRARCIGCHGVDGRGAGAITGADFTSPEGPLGRPDAELLASIRDGRRGEIGVMPAHRGILTDDESAAVLTFIRRRFGPEIVPAAPDESAAAATALAPATAPAR